MEYGGDRARLIKLSLFNLIKNGIEDIGWFDSGRQHDSVSCFADPIDEVFDRLSIDVKPNIVTLTDEDDDIYELEMGSISKTVTWDFYVDVYAENSAVGVALSSDIRDILIGRHNDSVVNEQGPMLSVHDYNQATPTVIFNCEITNVDRGRVKIWDKPWEKYWYIVHFEVEDSY